MRNTWKDWRFWVCAALFAALFCLLAFVFGNQDLRGPVSITYMVFAYVPIALAAGSWLLGLYKLWTGQWGREHLIPHVHPFHRPLDLHGGVPAAGHWRELILKRPRSMLPQQGRYQPQHTFELLPPEVGG